MLRSAPPSPLKGPVHGDGGRRGRVIPHGFLPSPSCEEHSVASEEPEAEESPIQTRVARLLLNLFKSLRRAFKGLTSIEHFSNVFVFHPVPQGRKATQVISSLNKPLPKSNFKLAAINQVFEP